VRAVDYDDKKCLASAHATIESTACQQFLATDMISGIFSRTAREFD
jgi:hypothetical protein